MKFVNKIQKPVIYLIYLVVPMILFFFSVSLKEARGPYYIGAIYDSEYTYLLTSLNAANFRHSNLTLHPGTPIQMIGGAILRIHAFNYSKLQEDVLKRPEYYLSHLSYFVIIINVIVLIIVGMAAYFLTGDILPGLIIQITPFLSQSILASLTRFNPEPFLFLSTLLLILVILVKLLKTTKTNGDNWKLILMFGIVAGFGLAVKVPFLPLVIIPFFLFKKFSSILKYISFTTMTFFLLLLPYYKRIIYSFGWLWDIVRHTGKYGKGSAGFLDLNTLLPNINELFRKEAVFMYTLLVLIAFIGFNLVVPRLRKLALKSIIFRALIGLLTANIFGFIMILKHFSLKYLLAGFSLTGLVVALTYMHLKDLGNEFPFNKRAVKFSFIFIFIMLGFISYRQLPKPEHIAKRTNKKLAVYKRVWDEYKDCKKISYYGSTSKLFALRHGDSWARGYHSDVLESMYGNDVYFYDIYRKGFFKWQKKVNPTVILADLENIIMFGPEIIARRKDLNIVNMTRETLADNNLRLVNTMPNKRGETVFKFEKIKSDSEFRAQRMAALMEWKDAKTPDSVNNIDYGGQFRLIKAFIQKDSNISNIKLRILWECRENREIEDHKLAITLVKNGKNIFGRYPIFCPYSLVLEKGELVLTEIIIPGNKFNKADFLGIRFNIQKKERFSSLKVKSKRTDQNQFRLLIPLTEQKQGE